MVKKNLAMRKKDCSSNKISKASIAIQKAIKKFNRAIPKSIVESISSVQVDIRYTDIFLQEIATGMQITQNSKKEKVVTNIIRYNKQQQKSSKLTYDKEKQILVNQQGLIATTTGSYSRGVKNTKAYVISKSTEIYVDTYDKNLETGEPVFTHAVFLEGVPVEIAGLIRINDLGKIVMISNESGHYKPNILDVYRAIKKLEQKMPNVFDNQCTIEILEFYKFMYSDFLIYMEHEVEGSMPYHKYLLKSKIYHLTSEKKYIKEGPFKLAGNNISNAIINLSKQEKKKLADRLKVMPNTAFHFISEEDGLDRIKVYTMNELLLNLVEGNNLDALQVLLDSKVNIWTKTVEGKTLAEYAANHNLTINNQSILSSILNNKDLDFDKKMNWVKYL